MTAERARDALKRQKTPPQLARLIVSALADEGVAPNHLLYGTGLSAAALAGTEHHISLYQLLLVIERAVELAPEPGVGLRVGRQESISTWGVLGYALMSCATNREALALGQQFQRASSSMLSITMIEEADALQVRLDSPVSLGRALPFCVEEMITGMQAVVPVYLGAPMVLKRISFSYKQPSYVETYESLFNCPLAFDQPVNAFWTLPPSDRKLEHADPASAAMCLKLVEQIVERYSSEEDLLHDIRRIVLQKPGQFPDMEQVAAELQTTSRTLRRKLTDLGTSYRQLVDQVREDLAVDYLQNSNLTVDQITGFLGYTEATNFRRAFKQWTGFPPSHFRKR